MSWQFRFIHPPGFDHPNPALSYRNSHEVDVAMLFFKLETRIAYLVVRKRGSENVVEKKPSLVTGTKRLLPVFTPLPPTVASPRQVFNTQTFNETDTSYSLRIGPVVENSSTVKIISHLQHADMFLLLDESDHVVFEIAAKLEAKEVHAFLAFCAQG